MQQSHAPLSAPLLAACLLLTSLLIALPGCRPIPPPYHPPVAVPQPKVEGVRYTIQRGDTLYSIARAYGAVWSEIVRANPGLDPRDLPVGQEIIIPSSTGPVPQGPGAAPPKPEFNPGHPGPIAAESAFVWPVDGDLIGKFRQRVPWRRGETGASTPSAASPATARA